MVEKKQMKSIFFDRNIIFIDLLYKCNKDASYK